MRMIFLLLGHTAIAVGFVGVFVPLLPTTPFVLLAAMCYSRGSDRFHDWLEHHPRFGPMIHSWREHGAIGVRAKSIAVVTVLTSVSYSVFCLDPPWSVVSLAIGAAVITFILSRPSAATADQQPNHVSTTNPDD